MSTRLEHHSVENSPGSEYRAVSALALGGLVGGGLSCVAIFNPMLWFAPVVAACLNLFALRRIARFAPALIGRGAAIVGLLLAVLFGGFAVARWSAHRWVLRHESREFAEAWFAHISQNEPQKAYQFVIDPVFRQPLDETLWSHYAGNDRARDELRKYVETPVVRALLALGTRATVRFQQTLWQGKVSGTDAVVNRYAVTFEEAGQRHTFLLNLGQRRHVLHSKGEIQWQLLQAVLPTAAEEAPMGSSGAIASLQPDHQRSPGQARAKSQ